MTAFYEFDVCRNILESLLAGVCVVDMKKKIVLWSDGAERITGHLRHEVSGRWCIGKAVLHCQQPGCEFCSEECPVAIAMKTARPVPKKNIIFWLPKDVEIYFDFPKQRYYRHHSFDHFMLFSVETDEKRNEPVPEPAP